MEWIAAGIFGLLIGVVGLLTGLKQLKNRSELNRWPTAPGKVVERGVYQPNIPSLGPPAFRHAPLVKYVYQVGGKEFTSDSIHPKRIQLPRVSTHKWAQKKAQSYPDDVVVHYNTGDPTESFLTLTSLITLVIVVTVSCLVGAYGILILIFQLVST
jgi:hypothetical protein